MFGRKKPPKHKMRKGRNSRKLDQALRQANINADMAYCTECHEWYNTANQKALDRHAH